MPSQITKLNLNGINTDISVYELPETTWTNGNNIVFDKGSYQRIPANEEHSTFSSENGATLLVSWDPVEED